MTEENKNTVNEEPQEAENLTNTDSNKKKMNKYRIIETREGGCTRYVEAYMLRCSSECNVVFFYDDNHRIMHTAPMDKVIIVKEND